MSETTIITGILISLILAIHPYTIYPATLWLIRAIGGFKKINTDKGYKPKVSIVFCCYNEEKSLTNKINNIRQLKKIRPDLEVLAYADGCSDKTVEILEGNKDVISYIASDKRSGKAHGMNTLLAKATGEIVIFTDANVILDESAPDIVSSYFKDKQVGCVCGHLKYVNEDGATAYTGGLYWKLEEIIKKLESDTGSSMGADGSLFAIRKELFNNVPVDIIDDFYTSMSILCAGHRLLRADDFIAYEKSTTKSKDEFFRKIRISCRAFNCHRLLWKKISKMSLLNIYKYVSHKLLRWFTIFFLAISGTLFLLLLQVSGYGYEGIALLVMAVTLLFLGNKFNIKLLSTISEIIIAFIATGAGVIQSLRGKRYQTWNIAQSSR